MEDLLMVPKMVMKNIMVIIKTMLDGYHKIKVEVCIDVWTFLSLLSKNG